MTWGATQDRKCPNECRSSRS